MIKKWLSKPSKIGLNTGFYDILWDCYQPNGMIHGDFWGFIQKYVSSTFMMISEDSSTCWTSSLRSLPRWYNYHLHASYRRPGPRPRPRWTHSPKSGPLHRPPGLAPLGTQRDFFWTLHGVITCRSHGAHMMVTWWHEWQVLEETMDIRFMRFMLKAPGSLKLELEARTWSWSWCTWSLKLIDVIEAWTWCQVLSTLDS